MHLGEASGYVPYTVYMARDDFMTEHPDIIEAFTRAIYKGQQWVDSHTSAEIAEVILPQFPDSDAEDLPARVTYSLESEGGYDFSGNKVIEIEFDKSTGKVSGLTADGVSINVKNVNLIRMNAVNLSGKRATVVLVVATGKHYVEYGS